MDTFSVRLATWPQESDPLRRVRTEVFVVEQNVAPDEEWDGVDERCVHVLACDGLDRPIGTGRLLPDGKIGRMAVVKSWRGRGVGSGILQLLMNEARTRGHKEVEVAAQTQAIPFYEKFGFIAYGEEFLDANMPHCWMSADLDPDRVVETEKKKKAHVASAMAEVGTEAVITS
ncbi:hypothetical protein CBR_g39197 [Chara braunii]|uniref:Glucosamine 6-phosphate N-acetyltransferase n=1 Tax=Chara braunii TaxID=69332 RepID=A0A388LRC5_CHABU|nr:hypothetical protein CBR_g39197 [Chara braunii]|eukprot:GBG84821.1 hypothetical protein CBR_g39197 [Chara braunii]